jgi:hypothetical protein
MLFVPLLCAVQTLSASLPPLSKVHVLTLNLFPSLLLSRADIAGKFAASAWGKKLAARQSKANMTDLDRYKAMVAKCKRSRLVRTAFNKLKKSA